MRQLNFSHEVLRVSRLMARLLLWSTGELELDPEDALAIARTLKARLLAMESQANEQLVRRARGPLACVEKGSEGASNGDAEEVEQEEDVPF